MGIFLCVQNLKTIQTKFWTKKDKMMRKFVNRWVKKEEGATAVEFSLIALPFILMIVGLIEMSLMFTATNLLESATGTASRLIKTGQLQQSGGNQQQMFEDALCDSANVFLDCDNIQYEVAVIPEDDGFSGAQMFADPAFDDDGNLEAVGFDTGGSNDVMLVRVIYRYPIITPLIQPILANGPNNTRLLMSTTVFQTEPYEFEDDE